MLNKEDLEKRDLIDNEKLNETILLLQELYSHMYERVGVPNIVDGHGEFGVEGSAHIHFTILIPPYDGYRNIKNGVDLVKVIFNTSVLPRKYKEKSIQVFDTIDRFFNQVKNWHKYEMSLSLDDKNADYYIDTEH